MSTQITYQLSRTHLAVRLKRQHWQNRELQVRMSRIKLSAHSASDLAEIMYGRFSRKLVEAGEKACTLSEMALIAGIAKDYYGQQLIAGDGKILET